MLYVTNAALIKLATDSFVAKSGDKFYGAYYKAVQRWQEGETRKVKGMEQKVGALRDVLYRTKEDLEILEAYDGVEAFGKLLSELKKPTVDECTLYMRYMAGEFKPPKKRGRGSCWEKVHELMADEFVLAQLEVIRIVLAFPGIVVATEKALERNENSNHWSPDNEYTAMGWQHRLDGLEECDDPNEFLPEEEMYTWLQQIEEFQLLDKMTEAVPVSEYS